MTEPRDLTFQPGLIVNQEFFDFSAMQKSAKNWHYLSRYRFGTGEFYGRHDGIQLNHMQFGHAVRHEGMMIDGLSPKDCLTIIILQKSTGHVCINGVKMVQSDIIILDDSKPYDFNSSHHTEFAIISISKSLFKTEGSHLLTTTDKLFKDKNNLLSDTVENEWKRVITEPEVFKNDVARKETEDKIMTAVQHTFLGQSGETCHLTQGEKTSLEIKSFLLTSLEETMTIQNISEEFKISDKTLQNSFKSLFGITPKHFIHLLKLNRAHEDLLHADVKNTNVSDISMKWGFSHFGRFAKDYKALFNVLPSETLNRAQKKL